MTVSNPLNVKLVVQQGSQGSDVGEKLDVMARRAHALAAVNASGFSDSTGHGGGKIGLGVVIADGQVIHTSENDKPAITAGLTKDGQLITGDYTAAQMLQQQVVSAASFKPQLIVDGEKNDYKRKRRLGIWPANHYRAKKGWNNVLSCCGWKTVSQHRCFFEGLPGSSIRFRGRSSYGNGWGDLLLLSMH
ncbi:hypothetical protein GCM10020331_024070 [Ectobacillus funiculus]